MPGGYFDPATPGHHELNEEEFGKAMIGTLAGLMGAWATYVGCDELHRIVGRIARDYEAGQAGPPHPLDLPDAAPWSFEEMKNACHVTLVTCCAGWSAHVGRAAVAEELGRMVEDESHWERLRRQVAMAVGYMVECDRQAAEQVKKGELH